MTKQDNIEVFEDTRKQCEMNQVLAQAIEDSVAAQEIILEDAKVKDIQDLCISSNESVEHKPLEHKCKEPANVIVSKKRSFEAASSYKELNVCVHNFASARHPGGGVENGAFAQEECLCRTSTLFFCLNTKEMRDGFYEPHKREKNNLYNDDCIYTPNVIVFKTDTLYPETMKEEDWYKVNVITCAAPNLRPSIRRNSNYRNVTTIRNSQLQAIHEKRMRRILDICKSNENEVVILGAFGCGAFMNSPEVVALAMHNVIKDYLYDFRTIEFAIYCGRDDTNYRVFDRTLKRLQK